MTRNSRRFGFVMDVYNIRDNQGMQVNNSDHRSPIRIVADESRRPENDVRTRSRQAARPREKRLLRSRGARSDAGHQDRLTAPRATGRVRQNA